MKLNQPHRRLLSLFLTTSLLSALHLSAGTFTVGSLTYTSDDENFTASVSGCDTNASGELIIPESVEYDGHTYSVTSIGTDAFDVCRKLTSVSIPNSVICIGSYAFYHCNSLTSVIIPNSVTTILNNAFDGCSSLTSVTIPSSVTYIGNSAFSNCSSLTTVTIPNSVTNIDDGVFSGCTGLTTVTIPNSVTNIRDEAFSGCTGLTTVTIPNSVTYIAGKAFSGCTGLTNIQVESGNLEYCSLDGVLFSSDKSRLIAFPAGKAGAYQIPNSVIDIDEVAFYNCTGLTSVTIPSSVTCIGENAFLGCSGLTNIQIESGNLEYCSLDGVLFNFDKSELVTFPAGKAGEYQIPSSVTSIGYNAFRDCSGLTSVSIPNSVTYIGTGAFSGCNGLTSVTIPSSVTNIGGVFNGCENLKSIYLFGKSETRLPIESVYTFYDNGYNYDNAVYLVGEITTTQTTAEFDVQKVGLVESFDFEYVNADGVTVKETVNQSGRVSLVKLPACSTITLRVTVHMAIGEAYEYNSEITTQDADDQSAIEMVKVEEAAGFDVYTPSGVCVRRNATDLGDLHPGIYIANGCKFIVR